MNLNSEKLIDMGEETVRLKSSTGKPEIVLARITKCQKSGHELNQ